MSELRPPPPPLWAPTFRKHLMKGLTRMDRRKARQLAVLHQNALDAHWRRAYKEWWDAVGWMDGAATPEDAWKHVLASRVAS